MKPIWEITSGKQVAITYVARSKKCPMSVRYWKVLVIKGIVSGSDGGSLSPSPRLPRVMSAAKITRAAEKIMALLDGACCATVAARPLRVEAIP